MNIKQVTSSNIAHIGYDEQSQTLEVKFSNGGIYTYIGVTAKDHDAFVNTPLDGSHGRHFFKHIMGKYPSSKAI